MSQQTSRVHGAVLACVYSLAVAFPDRVPDYVRQNSDALDGRGAEIRFGEYFIGRLRAKALSGPPPNTVYGEAMEIAGRAGAPELGPQLANDFMQSRTDMLLLADHLNSLLDAIEALRGGDLNPYQNTTLYQTITFVWENAGGLVLPGFLENMQQMAFELNEWYVMALMDMARADFLAQDWSKHTAKQVSDFVDKYEDAKEQEDTVHLLVYSSVVLGLTSQYLPLFGLTEGEFHDLHFELNIDPLIEFLNESDFLP